MDTVFYCLQDFLVYTKTATYILMGLGLLGLLGYFLFVTGRDENIRKY